VEQKPNKNLSEVHGWLASFTGQNLDVFRNHVEIIIAPPYPFISIIKEKLHAYPWIKLASQDISPFGSGSYTGAVSAHNLDGLVSYSLVGHSERRRYFHESNEKIGRKTELALTSNIEPILCVRNVEDYLGDPSNFVAYEPQEAIGSGHNESTENVLKIRQQLNLPTKTKFIYGGSVNGTNARDYLKHSEIDGLLPGKASLHADEFYSICLEAYALEK
jgi:triosephosphate isomerase